MPRAYRFNGVLNTLGEGVSGAAMPCRHEAFPAGVGRILRDPLILITV